VLEGTKGEAVQPDELRSWIEVETGRPVTAVERVSSGASRATYVVRFDAGADLVARVDTGDGPMAGTELSLPREAQAYRALADTDVRIPRLHAIEPAGRALLVDRAAGTHELTDLDPATRALVMDDYLDALADLHLVDPDGLELAGWRRPIGDQGHALAELDCWEGILRTRTSGPWPLARFACRALRLRAPTEVSRTVLCHGDVGPGNFLHDGRRVTAMLDWEFAHVGDPMDDLAWWVFRGHDMAGNCGDLAAQLARWSARTGLPVDVRSIDFYRAVVMLRWLVSVAVAIDAGGSGLDLSVHRALVPLLSVRLPRALAGLAEVELEDVEPLPDGGPGWASGAIDSLQADLTTVIAPTLTDPEARRRAAAAPLYLSHLAAVDHRGAAATEGELDDLAAVLGQRPDSVPLGHEALAAAIDQGTVDDDVLLAHFWRAGNRLIDLWPAARPRAFSPATEVPPVA
jgi:aminoglycoside phosphotransferase (APT) family kinase protein